MLAHKLSTGQLFIPLVSKYNCSIFSRGLIPLQLFVIIRYSYHFQLFHGWTKHIEVDCHFIQDKILNRNIFTPFVKFEYQHVDMFTKSLGRSRLELNFVPNWA